MYKYEGASHMSSEINAVARIDQERSTSTVTADRSLF